MPALKVLLFADFDAEQALHNLEHAVQHTIDREVLAHLFFADAVTLFTQFFAVVTQIPALQIGTALFSGKSLQLGQILLGKRFAAHRQVIEKIQHLLRAVGHLGSQRQVAVMGKAQQLGQLLTQLQGACHHRRVVELAGIGALL